MTVMTRNETPAIPGFEKGDFDVFTIEGLEPRMTSLIDRVRPKLTRLGDELAPRLAALTGTDMWPHVAKHARRTVNPPNDTWVAFADRKRGYKARPHFQFGLWSTHLFVQFAVIYECPDKTSFAERAIAELSSVRSAIPDDFIWSKDHMVPEGMRHGDLSDAELGALFDRLCTVKAAELTCGIHIGRGDAAAGDGAALARRTMETFETLLPLYRMAVGS